jgi:virginiamycin A acetyltransferase
MKSTSHTGDTLVGSDMWFGHESAVMPTVQIGDGAIIAARAVVTKNVSPYTVVGGNSAQPIRKRFPDEVIDQLIKIQYQSDRRGRYSSIIKSKIKLET